MSANSINYTKLTDRNVSFGLLRTNPKLTSNIKVTIDSSNNLWFNSIDATPELAQNKYKNFPIDPNSAHELNLHKFYDYGQTPNPFVIGTTITIDGVAKDLKDQFDFDYYTSGAKYLSSKNYKEKFSYFAPLYLDNIIPEYFVIFKIPNASNYTIGQWQSQLFESKTNKSQFAIDFFKEAIPITAYPLIESSQLGTYIRNIIQNPMYNKNPLYVNYAKNKYSIYRGPSISSGTYVEVQELLSELFHRAIPQLQLEEYIVNGFERNNVVHPNILNLEFLFNDNTSAEYSINRYIGFYCNLVELAQFNIDIEAMVINNDNSKPIPFKFEESQDIPISIINDDGISLRGISKNLSNLELLNHKDSKLLFSYLESKNNIVFPKNINVGKNQLKIDLYNTKLNLGDFFGPNSLFSQEEAKYSKTNSKSTVALEFVEEPNHLDKLRIYYKNGSINNYLDPYGRYDDIVFVRDINATTFINNEDYLIGYPNIEISIFNGPNPNDSTTFTPNIPNALGVQYISEETNTYYIWNGVEYVKGAHGARIYVNLLNYDVTEFIDLVNPNFQDTKIDLARLASTIIKIVSNLNNSYLTGKTYKNTAFIQTVTPGDRYGLLAIKALGNLSSKVKINGQYTTNVIYADGGHVSTTQAILPIGNIEKFKDHINNIVVKTETGWSKILRICNSTVKLENDELTYDDYLSYFNNATLILEDDQPIHINYDTIEIRNLFRPKLGVLSLFDIKDIDFYTYSSEYTKTPNIDLYQNHYIPEDIEILDFSKYTYRIEGDGEVIINDVKYSSEDQNNIIWQNTKGLHKYQVASGSVVLVQSNLFTTNITIERNDIAIDDEDSNIQTFPGFFSFGANHSKADKNLPTYEYREKYIPNNLSSEYHVYLENFSKEFANKSKIVPYISKWGLRDSTDARGNLYRLNSDIMFGKNNFGPSHYEILPSPENLTHEWFYIESKFNYANSIDLLRQNYYYFDKPFDWVKMARQDNYFEDYFTYIPRLGDKELDRPQYRYSKLIKDVYNKQYFTVFNGVKYSFIELEGGLSRYDRFNDYNFSILLKPIKEDLYNPQEPIKFRVIENINAKSIVLLIELVISDKSLLSPKLLQKNESLPDNRIDQVTVFDDDFLIYDDQINIAIDFIYITHNNSDGDLIFNHLLNSQYPKFNNANYLNGGYTYDMSTAQTSAIGQPTIPKNGNTIIVRKGSDVSKSFILTFKDSKIFELINTKQLSKSCVNYVNIDTYPQYLTIGNSKPCYLDNYTSKVKIIQESTNNLNDVLLNGKNLSIIKIVPQVLSLFGDYRLEFNEDLVSNLSYSFLYSAIDKKYNTSKSAYSTIKLSTGIDLSPHGVNQQNSDYYLSSTKLGNLTSTDIKLDTYINPKSGSHDTILNVLKPNNITSLPAFAPLMFISDEGHIKILVDTKTDFNKANSEIQDDLGNPNLTNHAITKTNEDVLMLHKSDNSIITLAKINLVNNSSGPTLEISKESINTGSSNTWTNEHQQYQLFGGKDFYTKLFSNLSFANFRKFLEKNSDLISWESYLDGELLDRKQFTIKIEEGDLIRKNTTIDVEAENVETLSKKVVGGFKQLERQSAPYELYRYAGEYDIIFKDILGFKQNIKIKNTNINRSNILINPDIPNFGYIPELSYVKYAKHDILDLERSSKYDIVYPLIAETNIDHKEYNILSSSWDYNYHYEYLTKDTKASLPGTFRIAEDYSFVSKLINLPQTFIIEQFNYKELTNAQFEQADSDLLTLKTNGTNLDLVYSYYPGLIKFKISFNHALIKSLLIDELNNTNRLDAEVQKFFVDLNNNFIRPIDAVIGDLTYEEFLYNYCKSNLLRLYELDNIMFYEKMNHNLTNNDINIVEVPFNQLANSEYTLTKNLKINSNTNGIIIGSIVKKTNAGISLVPKLKIKYI